MLSLRGFELLVALCVAFVGSARALPQPLHYTVAGQGPAARGYNFGISNLLGSEVCTYSLSDNRFSPSSVLTKNYLAVVGVHGDPRDDSLCGRCLKVAVSGTDGEITVQIVDLTHKIPRGHVALSDDAFAALGVPVQLQDNIDLRWYEVDCPRSSRFAQDVRPFGQADSAFIIERINKRNQQQHVDASQYAAPRMVKRNKRHYGYGYGYVTPTSTTSASETISTEVPTAETLPVTFITTEEVSTVETTTEETTEKATTTPACTPHGYGYGYGNPCPSETISATYTMPTFSPPPNAGGSQPPTESASETTETPITETLPVTFTTSEEASTVETTTEAMTTEETPTTETLPVTFSTSTCEAPTTVTVPTTVYITITSTSVTTILECETTTITPSPTFSPPPVQPGSNPPTESATSESSTSSETPVTSTLPATATTTHECEEEETTSTSMPTFSPPPVAPGSVPPTESASSSEVPVTSTLPATATSTEVPTTTTTTTTTTTHKIYTPPPYHYYKGGR